MAVWDKFIVHLRDQKRYASHTLRAYENDLTGFFAYCGEAFDCFNPGEVNRQIVRSYIVSLVDKGMSRRSVQRKISTLKSYYNYLIREAFVEQNPASDIQLPHPGNELPAFIPREAMEELIDLLPGYDGYPEARTRMVLLLLYGTGMRVSELTGLELSSLSPSGDVVRVNGKRNKQRDIPLGSYLRNEIKLYVDQRLRVPGNNNAFFITDKGKPIYPKWVYNNVRSWLSLVTSQEKRSPHILRHSFATHMLDDGADLNAIKEILGHASLAATQVYTHNTIEKLRKIYEQAHPRA